VHDGTLRAIDYATSIGATSVQALFLVGEGTESAALGHDWIESGIEIPLIMVEAPFRDLVPPLLAEIRKHTSRPNTVVTVVLPELVPAHWWQEVLHSQTAVSLKSALLFEPNVVLTSVPLHLNDRDLMVESTRNIGPR
jgi:hypothetical protein